MFSAEQVRELSIEVDRQLMAARGMPIADRRDAIDELRMLQLQLRVQKDAIVVATEEEADGFLRKFARVARRDVCEEGGLLNQQWEKYQDLGREDTLVVVAGALGLMRLANPVVVAIAVPIYPSIRFPLGFALSSNKARSPRWLHTIPKSRRSLRCDGICNRRCPRSSSTALWVNPPPFGSLNAICLTATLLRPNLSLKLKRTASPTCDLAITSMGCVLHPEHSLAPLTESATV